MEGAKVIWFEGDVACAREALSLATVPRLLTVIHVDTTSSYVIDFRCALDFGEWL
jgi:hypothetical protein